MSLLSLLKSSGSLATMANAMLEEDFKSSHPDLTLWDRGDPESKLHNNNDKENRNKTKRTSDPRSVVIQVPPKRRKLDPSLTARRLVHEIGTSATPADRLKVLQRAKEFLDHGNTGEHDDEIDFDLDVALTKQLVLLVLKLSRCRSNLLVPIEDETQAAVLEEVSSTLEALEMVYRAGDAALAKSFSKIGPDLLHVLVSVMDEELNKRVVVVEDHKEPQPQEKEQQTNNTNKTFNPIQDNDSSRSSRSERSKGVSPPPLPPTTQTTTVRPGSPEGNLLILKCTKVMGNLARVGKATMPMAFFPGLLRCMLNLINFQPYENVPWEARLSALWILGQLACNPENMQMMMCTPGLVRSLVRVGCRALHGDDPMEVTMEVLRSRSLSSRALLNLSWKPENKIPLSENLQLVELLAQLAVHRKAPALNNSKTVQGVLQQTRCHAVGALRNLAAAPRRTKISLCAYKQGHVLDALTDVALNDPDDSIRNRAFAAIHNLAVHDNAARMVERPALVLALKDVLLEEQQQQQQQQQDCSNNTSGSSSPRSHASATLLVLERSITPDMPSYSILRDLLDAVNPTTTTEEDGEEENDDISQSNGSVDNGHKQHVTEIIEV